MPHPPRGSRSAPGFPYYYHAPSGTSSWERPGAGAAPAPAMTVAAVPVSASLAASLAASGQAVLLQVQAESGGQVHLPRGATCATVTGTARAVAKAKALLERKAAALEFIARARPASGGGAPPRRAVVESVSAPDYNFRGIVAAPRAPVAVDAGGGAGAGALGLLGECYGDSDADDE